MSPGDRRPPSVGRGSGTLGAIGIAAAFLCRAVAAGACPMCQAAVDAPGDPLVSGINASILFMLAMPFAVTAAVGAWFAYMYRRRARPEPEPAAAWEEGTW